MPKNDSIKKQITALLVKSIQMVGITEVSPQVSVSDSLDHGDYTTNICLVLAGQMKQKPMDLANKIGDAIRQYQKESKTEILKDVKIASPGFLNLFVNEANFISQINRVLTSTHSATFHTKSTSKAETTRTKISALQSHANAKTSASTQGPTSTPPPKGMRVLNSVDHGLDHQINPKRIVVEFTDPNPFKEFHAGHLYSNAVGESLSRLLEAVGNTVHRVNYFGDVGMHVAKSIWGLQKKMTHDKIQLTHLENMPFKERIQYLGSAYALGATAYEEKNPEGESAKEEMKNLNFLIFIAAQENLKKLKGWEPHVNYRHYVKVDEEKLQIVAELYSKGRSWSLEYFESIYKRLGTQFAGYYPESMVGEVGYQLVSEHLKKGTFEKSDGAVIFRGESSDSDEQLHTRVFINSLGLPTYEAKELGLAPTKFEDWAYDRSIIVTGKEINEYFHVLLAAMAHVRPDLASKTKHIGHGMVRLPSGKMSSRTGKVLTGESLIEEAKQKIKEILDQNKSKYTKEEHENIAEKAAVAAIKYSLLKVGLPSDITFDIEKSVNFDGDSGPYLQYTYARCRSLLRKHSQIGESGKEEYSIYVFDPVLLNQNTSILAEERILLRNLSNFEEVVKEAAHKLTPNILCTYLFALASDYNTLYAHQEILGNPLRLMLTAAMAKTVKEGLYLLGIETLERM